MASLDNEKRDRLNSNFPQYSGRIDDLCRHSREEVAQYVRHLVETPCADPEDPRPRWRLYGWTLLGVDKYMEWPKWMLVERILAMESDDDQRRAGVEVKVANPKPKRASEKKSAGPVQAGKPIEIDSNKDFSQSVDLAGEPIAKDQDIAAEVERARVVYDEGWEQGKKFATERNPHKSGTSDNLKFHQGFRAGNTSRKLI